LFAALLCLASRASAQTYRFSDGDFPDANWQVVTIKTTKHDQASAQRIASGGNPGAYRQTQHSVIFGSTVRGAQPNQGAVYTPAAQGAIFSIDFSYDGISMPTNGEAANVAYALLLVQGGSYYISAQDTVSSPGWTTFAHQGLTAGAFTLISGTGSAQPDFSCNGAPITLGYQTANSDPHSGQPLTVAYTTTSGIDNWQVAIHSGGSCNGGSPVPCACELDQRPAATLLLPYFEVDLGPYQTGSGAGANTQFTMVNSQPTAVLTNVVIWSDYGVPVLHFNVYLTGYDMQSLDLGTILGTGAVPQTGPASPAGAPSEGATFPGCDALLPPGNVPGFLVAQLQRALTGKLSWEFGGCPGAFHGDDVARGYVTIDVVNECSLLVPGDASTGTGNTPYFAAGGTGVASNQNALFGTYVYLDPARQAAEGFSLVAIKANGTDPATSTPGRYTFYGRYDAWTAVDNREPLATTFAAVYGSRGSDLIVWRDSKMPLTPAPCLALPAWYPLGAEGIVTIDQQENMKSLPTAPQSPAPGGQANLLPLATQRLRGAPFSIGWLFLDLSNDVLPAGPNPPADPLAAQAWVTVINPSAGRSFQEPLFFTGYTAVPLDSACAAAHFFP
jgi:hypothetical protein